MSRRVLPVEVCIKLYASGLSGAAIAAQYGVHPCSVINLLRRHGEPRRTLCEAQRLAYTSGRNHAPWKGKRLSREHRRKLSRGGPMHWHWRDGRHARVWRNAPRVACERCGSRQRLCNTHRNNDARDFRESNRAVLCVPCHRSVRKKLYWRAWRCRERLLPFNGVVGWKRVAA